MRLPHVRAWGSALAFAFLAAVALCAMDRAHAQTVRASFYGAESGTHNADGSRFNPWAMTAAHRSYPFGTRLSVCYRACAIVTVRDRGPAAWTGRSLDLARGAARAIGLEAVGVADVTMTVIGRVEAALLPRHARRHHHR